MSDKEKTASEKAADERATITTTVAEEEKKDDEKEIEQEEKEEEIEKDNDDEKDDEKEEEGEKELETKDEKDKTIAKLEKTIERLQRRVGKTTGEKGEIAKELNAAKASLEAKLAEGEGLTEEEVERRAEDRANQLVAQKEFVKAVNKLADDATKIDKNFPTKIKLLAEEVSPIPSHMVAILEDLDNGAAILNHLSDNVDEYETIHILSPAKMATALSKIGNKLEQEKKPKPKQISKVPEPPETIKGGNSSPNILTGKESMDEFVRIRNQQTEERRKARLR